MTPSNPGEEVRSLLFRLLHAPDGERDSLLAHERSHRPQVAAAAEQAFAEVMRLLDLLPTDPDAARAALATGPTLSPLVQEAIDWALTAFGQTDPVLNHLPPIQAGEMLPNYTTELAEGTLFGYYLIERRLGAGGMGIVYLARDTRFSDQPRVALKLLLQIDAERLDRFRDEASFLYVLAQESNVVGIRDYGTTPAPFIAMEYVDGGHLGEHAWPRSGRDRARAVAELVRTLARTLQEAHRRGIFHLDLKPDNVLLHPRRGPLLADFSLAQRVREGSALATAPAGTPAYLAPEQAACQASPIPTFIDVYGLGAILYVLLTRQPPFARAQEESFGSFLTRIQTEDPQRPRALDRTIPTDLEAICLHCLCKQPDQRYTSAAEMADDLERFLAGDRPRVAHWPWQQRLRHFAWRKRPQIAAGLTTVLGITLLILSLLYRARAADAQARSDRDRARVADAQAENDRDRARRAVEEREQERRHKRQQIRMAARFAAEQGNWQLAMELYDTAIRDYEPDEPERLVLEVERLPGWFLYRSREEVAAELKRLDQQSNLQAKERAKVQLYQGDLRLCEDGRTPAVLALLRTALNSGKLDKADAKYAEALLAPTSREALAKLRELVGSYKGHYRGRVAFLGLLFVRGELGELRKRLELHEDRFPGDVTAVFLEALLDILQKDDLPHALALIQQVHDRIGQKRHDKWSKFLTLWSRLLRALARQDTPSPNDVLRMRSVVGGDRDLFSLNLPTVCWLWEHWGAAVNSYVILSANVLGAPFGIFPAPEKALRKWQAVCEDSPEATFLVHYALSELLMARYEELHGRKNEALQHLRRSVELSYQAADARTPTLIPRSEWRYTALNVAVVTDVVLLATEGQPPQPAQEKRLYEALHRVVNEGRVFPATRAQRLPVIVSKLAELARNYPQAVSSRLAHRLLIEWIQEESDNPVPYRLQAKLALDLDQPMTAWSLVALWYADKRHRKDAQLDEFGKQAKKEVAKLLQAVAPGLR